MLLALSFGSAGCASNEDVLVSTSGRASLPDAGGTGSFTSHGMDGSVTFAGSFDGATGTSQHGDASRADAATIADEICDGIDNDQNGIVDDLDLGHDGVCDCLRIATLGSPGDAHKTNVFNDWLDARSDQPAVSLVGATLTKELLAPYQVLVAEDLSTLGRNYTTAEVDALEAWIRAGGGLMTLIGYAEPDERTNANLILERFGSIYGEQQILSRGTAATTVPVTIWLGPHPVIQGVTRVGVDNGYPVVGNGTTLAQGGGYDLLKVQEVDQGHLIIWTDEWITYDSEWSEHPDYQVAQLWLNAIKWLTAARICQVPMVVL